MVNDASVAAVESVVDGEHLAWPLYESYCFSRLPGTMERLLTGQPAAGLPADCLAGLPDRVERLVVVLVDAFGWRFLERFAEHPFLRRLERDGVVSKLTSQFPSTTTAHVTTLATGEPVGAHGLYEWFLHEPALGAVICPILFAYPGDDPGTLGADPSLVYPDDSLVLRLATHGVRSAAVQPALLRGSHYTRWAARGADELSFETFAEGLEIAGERAGYSFVYLDRFDTALHLFGPDSAEADAEAIVALDALEASGPALGRGGPGLLLVTADHGQTHMDPEKTLYVDTIWPGLVEHVAHGIRGPLVPAGSARDLFLHVLPGHEDEVVRGLRETLGPRARVEHTADLVEAGLFGEAGPRLLERLAEVVVLPGRGESAYWWGDGALVQHFRGHHGGLTRDEMETFLGALPIG